MAVPMQHTDEPRHAPEWTLGDRFRKARLFAGIKSTNDMAVKLSEYLGVTVGGGAVGAWERGTNQPSKGGLREHLVIRAYADICGVDEEWLRSRCFQLLPTSQGQLSMLDDLGEPLDLFAVPDLAILA